MTLTYAFAEFARLVGEYAHLIDRGMADIDLPEDQRLDVAFLLTQAQGYLVRQEPDMVDPRRTAMTHVRQLGTAMDMPGRAVDRAVDILSNL